jgi:hypothetical protein
MIRLNGDLCALLRYLQANRALTRNDEIVIIGRHHDSSAFGRDLPRKRFPITGVAIVGNHLTAQPPRVFKLGSWRILGHDDGRFNTQQGTRCRNSLRVIAG